MSISCTSSTLIVINTVRFFIIIFIIIIIITTTTTSTTSIIIIITSTSTSSSTTTTTTTIIIIISSSSSSSIKFYVSLKLFTHNREVAKNVCVPGRVRVEQFLFKYNSTGVLDPAIHVSCHVMVQPYRVSMF